MAFLERIPEGVRDYGFIEISGPEEEQKLGTAADATITWIHRGAAPVGKALVAAVSTLDLGTAGNPAREWSAQVEAEQGGSAS